MWRIKGASEEEIAERLGICRKTFLKYMRKYPEFEAAVSFDRSKTEKLVEQALLKLALGYTVRVKKVHKLKKSHYDEREKKVEEERLETAEEEQSIPPNLSAQTFWLKSRCPEHWGEKTNDQEENKSLFGIVEIPFSELSEDKGEDKNE